MATSAKTYIDYCRATIIQNRIESNAVRFTGDPLVEVFLLMYLVGLLKDTSLSWFKFLDDMHIFISHDHEHLYFSMLKYMRDHGLFNCEAWED